MSERLAPPEPPAAPSESPEAEAASPPQAPSQQEPAQQEPIQQEPIQQEPIQQEPIQQEIDPLAEMRASLGLPHREGGTPITANLDVTLRRLGWGMLGLGTAFLLLWRILSWVNA